MSGRVYCTTPGHRPGEHDQGCLPSADPGDPALRVIRVLWGQCPDCDRTDEHEHVPHERGSGS